MMAEEKLLLGKILSQIEPHIVNNRQYTDDADLDGS
jgi:hypothetical protein